MSLLFVGAAAFLLQPPEALAAPPAATDEAVPGWTEMVDGLRDLPARILAKLPEDERNDPQVQQEVGRLALSAVAMAGLTALGGAVDHPMFLPANGPVITIGQPNSDTVYKMAAIVSDGVYRLRGHRGDLRLAVIAQQGRGPPRSSLDLGSLHVDAHGDFDVILSRVRPAGYAGDWWPLEPDVTMLLVRQVSSDWGKEKDPTLSIERVDMPVRRPRPSAEDLERRLAGLAAFANFIGPLRAGEPERLRREGYVNKVKELNVLDLGGLVGQFYYDGAYELTDEEALIIETKVPATCRYWSMILTNEIYETTDWYNNESSLNDSQARLDKDRVLRVVVSARDPGVPNWLDTAGYPRGVVQGRWTGCDSQPMPTVRKVALAEVRRLLPPDTPVVTAEQREQIVRERRTLLQQRPLW